MEKEFEGMVQIPKELAKELYNESKELSILLSVLDICRSSKSGKYLPIIINYSDNEEIEKDISSLLTETYGMCLRIEISDLNIDSYIKLEKYMEV